MCLSRLCVHVSQSSNYVVGLTTEELSKGKLLFISTCMHIHIHFRETSDYECYTIYLYCAMPAQFAFALRRHCLPTLRRGDNAVASKLINVPQETGPMHGHIPCK